jgi:RND superfamily putative drug exporter
LLPVSPLLLALTAIIAAFGLVALPTSIVPIDETVYEVILLIGLAVGVDYSMFYLKREREERAAGRSASAAVAAAAATSGRSVLISGLTVIVAMAGMFLAGVQGMSAFAMGTIIVVAVAMVGSLTVLPAILCTLGERVERGRVPLVRRLRRDDGEGRIWGAIVERVLRRPVLSVVLAGGLLVALAIPALQLRTVDASPETFPKSLSVIKTYDQLQESFPGDAIPANVVVKAENVRAPAVKAAIAELEQRALSSDRLQVPIDVDVNNAGTVANIAIRSTATVRTAPPTPPWRAARRPRPGHGRRTSECRGRRDGLHCEFEGLQRQDQVRRTARLRVRASARLPPHALRLPLPCDRGEGDRPQLALDRRRLRRDGARLPARLGQGHPRVRVDGGMDSFLPIFMFVILFGLSMDYHVFILSRIREAYDGGMTTEQAVTHGIKTTAGVVTSAAFVMVCVFAVFRDAEMLIFKQFGSGLRPRS